MSRYTILDYHKHHKNTIPPCNYCKIHKSFTSLAKLLTRSSSTASGKRAQSFSGSAYVRVHVESIIISVESLIIRVARERQTWLYSSVENLRMVIAARPTILSRARNITEVLPGSGRVGVVLAPEVGVAGQNFWRT